MACYPWIVPHQAHGQSLDEFPDLKRWFAAVQGRPGAQRAYARAPESFSKERANLSDQERRILFGQTAQR
jgi:GSH-dependent disulfide-bond oxidoreductase